MQSFKRIAVIGLPGSGKSTFSIKLGRILKIPVHHLDKHIFDGKHRRDAQEFLLAKEALIKQESWIIEGCSIKTLEMRYSRADIVIYFDLPRLLCLFRIFKRQFNFDKQLEDTGCLKGINWALIKYIWTFDRDKRPIINELKKKYPEVDFIIFKRSNDAEAFQTLLQSFTSF